MKKILSYLFFLLFLTSVNAEVFIYDDFKTMDMWKDLIFPKIENTTKYSIADGESLRIESNKSASGLIMNESFDVYNYPPKASLNYIWSNKKLNTDFLFSPYTKKAAMIPVEEGKENLGIWLNYSVNILEDYRKIYGTDPPGIASLAIMGDSDNTGENSPAFIDYIKLESQKNAI